MCEEGISEDIMRELKMTPFLDMAHKYKLQGGTVEELCKHNSKVAAEAGKIQVWYRYLQGGTIEKLCKHNSKVAAEAGKIQVLCYRYFTITVMVLSHQARFQQ